MKTTKRLAPMLATVVMPLLVPSAVIVVTACENKKPVSGYCEPADGSLQHDCPMDCIGQKIELRQESFHCGKGTGTNCIGGGTPAPCYSAYNCVWEEGSCVPKLNVVANAPTKRIDPCT